jgi:two-component system response regulator PilR (NtrC family)
VQGEQPAAKTVSQEAMRLLMAYEWPGNVRQFENAIEYAATMSGLETEIRPEGAADWTSARAPRRRSCRRGDPDEGIHFTSVVSSLERDLILRCLEKTGGNKAPGRAAAALEPHDVHRQAAAAERRGSGRGVAR